MKLQSFRVYSLGVRLLEITHITRFFRRFEEIQLFLPEEDKAQVAACHQNEGRKEDGRHH